MPSEGELRGIASIVGFFGPTVLWVHLLYRKYRPKPPPYQSLLGAIAGGLFVGFFLGWLPNCIGSPYC
jgi:hypothetical protein